MSIVIEKWTRDDLVSLITRIAGARHKKTFDQVVEMEKSGALDRCDDAEMIALINLLPENERREPEKQS